jgi:hypothetical protein
VGCITLLGRPGYAIVVLPNPHTVLVDQLAPKVARDPDERGTEDREEQGLATSSVTVTAPEAG